MVEVFSDIPITLIIYSANNTLVTFIYRKYKNAQKSHSDKTVQTVDKSSLIQESEARQFETLESKVKMAMSLRRNGFFSIRKLQEKLSTSFLENLELIKSEKL